MKTAGGYISGEELSRSLGVTRSAVWKTIQALRADGYTIDSVTNKGYRLLQSPDVVDEECLRRTLDCELVGTNILHLKTVDSTNNEVKRRALGGEPGGLVVVSDVQTGGKGRFGRVWQSDSGGLYFSVLIRPELPPAEIAAITLAAGYAVCLAVRQVTGLDARIKWPNDIIIGNRKICGILTEMSAQSDRIDYAVIGIGVNVNNTAFPDELKTKALSIRMALGSPVDKTLLLTEIIRKLDRVLSEFLVSLSVDDLEQFKTFCATLGRRVCTVRGGKEITGTACDIAPTGKLIIMTDSGEKLPIDSGEVTVQGIY